MVRDSLNKRKKFSWNLMERYVQNKRR